MRKLALLLTLLAACGTTDSGSLLTSGMSAVVGARADGSGNTTVYAELFSGYPEQLIFVKLTSDDQLIASHGSDSQVMQETQLVTIVDHTAVFPVDGEGETFTIDLERSVDAGAPMSTATLPAPFTLGTVPSSASRSADLTITWSPAGTSDSMTWTIDGDCLEHASGTATGDTGSLVIPANTIHKQTGGNVADSCTATLTVSRVRAGVLDPHFGKGGSSTGSQDRVAMFTTTL